MVVVNYNSWPDVAALVAVLAGTAEVAAGVCEVVVVDNASDGPVPPALLEPPPGVRLVPQARNKPVVINIRLKADVRVKARVQVVAVETPENPVRLRGLTSIPVRIAAVC